MTLDGIAVSGGAGGLTADLAAMQEVAQLLAGVASDVGVLAMQAAALGAEIASSRTAAVDPVGAARVGAELVSAVAGPGGLVACGAGLGTLAFGLSTAARMYAQADCAASAALARVRDSVAESAGAGVLVAATVGLPMTVAVASVGVAAWSCYRGAPLLRREAGLALQDGVAGRLRPDTVDDRCARVVGDQRQLMGKDVETVRDAAISWVARHPAAVEQLVLGVPAFLDGATGPVTVAGMPVGAADGSVGGELVWPPRRPSELAAAVSVLGAGSPYLVDGRVQLRAVGAPSGSSPAATGVTGALQRLVPYTSADQDRSARVRVERIQRAGVTSWSVYVPPTQTWRFDGGTNPFDGSTNVRAVGGQSTAAGQAVTQVLRQSGARPGEPVMLAGYSQGGLTAMQLAADERFRREFSVSTVLSVGSPVAGFDVPDDVRVLSIEHAQDLVPALDDGRNPDRPSWTTVRRDLAADPASGWGPGGDGFSAHRIDYYLETAQLVDGSTDESVTTWEHAAEPFLDTADAEVAVVEWQARRVEE